MSICMCLYMHTSINRDIMAVLEYLDQFNQKSIWISCVSGQPDKICTFLKSCYVHSMCGGFGVFGQDYLRLISMTCAGGTAVCFCVYTHTYIYGCHFGIFSSIYINSIEISCASGAWG